MRSERTMPAGKAMAMQSRVLTRLHSAATRGLE